MAASGLSWAIPGFPVLMYHGVARGDDEPVPPGERKYWVTASQLRDHLSCIREVGYHVTGLAELWWSPPTASRIQRSVALTFDDGCAADYEVSFPLLLEAGVRADFFVNTATIGRPGFLDWSKIAEMQRAGMSFHSHGHEHVPLSGLSLPMLQHQIRESKQRLQERLEIAPEFLALPYGLLDRRVLEVAREQGFRAVCTSRAWPARPGVSAIGRIAIYRHTRLDEFRRIVMRHPVPYLRRALRAGLVSLPKRALLRFRPGVLGVRVLEKRA